MVVDTLEVDCKICSYATADMLPQKQMVVAGITKVSLYTQNVAQLPLCHFTDLGERI